MLRSKMGRISVHSYTLPVSPSCSDKVNVVLYVYWALVGNRTAGATESAR